MRHRAGFWVLLSLAALLCFLGYLQYRWIDRLATTEHEREGQSLRTSINRVAGAFDVEITRAHMAFPPMPVDMGNGAFWADRLQMWNEFAPYPRMVKDVYFSDGTSTLKLTPTGMVSVEGQVPTATDPVSVTPVGRGEGSTTMRTIVFDGDYIRTELLPQLIARHVSKDRFGVRVSAGEHELFSSTQFRTEATTRLFAFRPECFGPMRRESRGGPPGGGPGGGGPPPHRGPPHGGPPRGESRGGGPPPWMEGGASIVGRRDVTCEGAPPSREPGRWTLEAGLAESAVTGLNEFRTRTLLLSFGVLAILAIGIGMLSLYAHRAQVLAQRQMEFAMAVSHELRTPLTIIRVAADSLSEGLVADTKKYGEMIRRETIRLGDMVEQVLVFARTQRADIKPNFESVEASEVIDRALSAVGPTLDSAGVRVETDVAEDLPTIKADANLVSAGLQNLLMNAAKYASSGGVVRVRAEKREQTRVSIVVEDEGPGVRPSELDRIFSPFYRGSDAANSRIPGLGLGLHLVKRIAEAHGGAVRAGNRNGRGFEIEMRIPAVES